MFRKFLIYFIVFTLLFGFFSACISQRVTSEMFAELYPEAKITEIEYDGRSLGYMNIFRNDTFPTLFLLHGSPSSMDVFKPYYHDQNLADWANIISADRPGYGLSGLGRSETSVLRQAEKMWKILENEGFPSPLYIIGASYGGTVAAKMAMLRPDLVDGIVFISASLAPGKETIYDISYIIRFPPFSWLFPAMINVANDEKLTHYEALTEMLPFWDNIRSPVVLIQGAKDRLIFPENVDFAKRKLVNSPFVESHMLEGEKHFLQLKYKEFILERVQHLIQLNNSIEERPSITQGI